MPISFENLFLMLKRKGLNKTYLRDNGIHPAIISKLSKNKLSTESRIDTVTIEKLCRLLNCDVSDIMEYIPDNLSDTLISKKSSKDDNNKM